MNTSPKSLGYRFPAEWERHSATWLSWPHKEASWPGKIDTIYPVYADFIKILATGERVCINVADDAMKNHALKYLSANGTDLSKVEFYPFPTNDAWCRDHGPAFLVNPSAPEPKIVIDWDYNAWGDKYPPYDLDDIIPTLIGRKFGYPVFKPGIVMEGGSVEFNGKGTLLTTSACLLNPNRNPHLNQDEIEGFLRDYYAVDHILWLGDGIVGDDTDGHIDDLTRFVNHDTVVTVIESNKKDENYDILQDNLKELNKMRLESGKQMNVVELPMPDSIIFEDQRLPASYANFYIANSAVIVPTYRCKQDDQALDILSSVFKDRKVIGLDSVDIIWGLGSFHCLSQQEPE
ncbi:MAG: agmatine deiminase family protein [Bacteroidetes bacterium]|nr:agmatine deiminase family protein [Bacteroidota bacterium]